MLTIEADDHLHFVTGKLAEHAVRSITKEVAQKFDFKYSIEVLPITVAALITPKWLVRHLNIPKNATRLVVPGYMERHMEELNEQISIPIVCGPRDIRDLSRFFGDKSRIDANYGAHRIEILAEINHAPGLTTEELVKHALRLRDCGADVIDLGCTPGSVWHEVGNVVRALREVEIRVSIDSFDPIEVQQACDAGAELVLSVNSSNCEAALDWNTEVVVIPDVPGDKKSFEKTIDFLAAASVPMRLDPILEPIGCGFAKSLQRYLDCRTSYPDAKMMMGIGNITELTDADSAGVNVLLLGICEELGIESVLTTEVINWARTSVQECNLARKLVHFACQNRIPPKHLEPNLVLLRDQRQEDFPIESIAALAQSIKDNNIRIFTSENQIHAASAGVHAHDEDPFLVMEKLLSSQVGDTINPSHAFYLGFEMAKALTANTLGKQYTQDESLNWGFLTREEDHHRLNRGKRKK